ncbi:MAG: methyltransferase domain-containing protein [Dehalococcoidia bacterium]|nr:MAG: methyltransferase domain-containing protein [Dehalococcoidia bacterium]
MSPRKRSSVPSRRRPSVPKALRPKPVVPEPPEYLRRLGVQPRKSLGQHFLTDEFILGDIARACCPNGGETILEIGSGPGGLTEELARLAGHVVGVEIDEHLAASTRERLKGFSNLHIIAADVMDYEPDELLAEGGAAPPYTA